MTFESKVGRFEKLLLVAVFSFFGMVVTLAKICWRELSSFSGVFEPDFSSESIISILTSCSFLIALLFLHDGQK